MWIHPLYTHIRQCRHHWCPVWTSDPLCVVFNAFLGNLMICPTYTRFLVMVGTCKIFFIHPLLSTWLRGTSPMCSIVWMVLSVVSMNPDRSGFSRVVNYSSWFLIWFETPTSTNHTSPCVVVLASIELAWCFIANIRLPLDHPVLQT